MARGSTEEPAACVSGPEGAAAPSLAGLSRDGDRPAGGDRHVTAGTHGLFLAAGANLGPPAGAQRSYTDLDLPRAPRSERTRVDESVVHREDRRREIEPTRILGERLTREAARVGDDDLACLDGHASALRKVEGAAALNLGAVGHHELSDIQQGDVANT